MDIPLSKHEIAQLLNITAADVEELWSSKQLVRSLYHAERDCADLAASSDFDVLTYMLWAGVLPVRLTVEKANLWVTNLAEVLQYQDATHTSAITLANALLECSVHDRLCDNSLGSHKTAYVCASGYLSITDSISGHVAESSSDPLFEFHLAALEPAAVV